MTRLAILRQIDGLKLSELSKLVGIDRSTLWRWEHGRICSNTSCSTPARIRIESFYGCSFHRLVETLQRKDLI